jgi:sulfate transport system permease protein
MRAAGPLLLRTVVVTYTLALIGAPLVAVLAHAVGDGPAALARSLLDRKAASAMALTVGAAFLVAVVNAVMGTATAWALCRLRLPGRQVLEALMDLPFALPTLVAGMMLVSLFGPQAPLGAALAAAGVPVAFALPGIVLALLFVTLPLVVRAVEPVVLGLDRAEEEAARCLGATPLQTFFFVTLRSISPAITYGTLQCFSRALAEFGAVVVISGNIPFRTLTAPVYVLGEVESGETRAAAGVSAVLILLAVAMSYASRTVRRRLLAAGAP